MLLSLIRLFSDAPFVCTLPYIFCFNGRIERIIAPFLFSVVINFSQRSTNLFICQHIHQRDHEQDWGFFRKDRDAKSDVQLYSFCRFFHKFRACEMRASSIFFMGCSWFKQITLSVSIHVVSAVCKRSENELFFSLLKSNHHKNVLNATG